MSSKQLIRYVVLSVEPVLGQFDLPLSSQGSVASHATPASHAVWEASSQGSGTMGSRARRSRLRGLSSGSGVHRKTRLAECVVARERDLGVNDTQFTCVTHLGNILKEGDVVLGYDFTVANWNLDDETEDVLEHEQRPDLVLVQKSYEASKESKRKFELKKLPVDEGVGLSAAELKAQEEDYELFMREVETDKELRAKMNLFKKRSTAAALSGGAMQVEGAGPADGGGCGGGGGDDDDDDDDENGVRLDELLDELALAGSVAAAAAAAGHKHTAAFAASAMMPPPLPAPSAGPHMETIIELEEPLIVSSDVAASTPAFSFGAAGGGTGAGSRSQVSDSFNAGSYDPTAMKFL